MSIQEFKSNFLGGGARPNQFKVELVFPGFAQGAAEAGRVSEFLCKSTTLPGSDLGIAPAFFRGRQIPLAGERQFRPWDIIVYNDTNFLMRNAFESWMNQINNLQYNTGITNPSAYTVDMQVHQLGRNNEVLKSYKFIGAFPQMVSPINLDFGANDQLEEFQVSFVYAHYVTEFNSKSGISVGINTPLGGITI